MEYIKSDNAVKLNYETLLKSEEIVDAVKQTNTAIKYLDENTKKFSINVFETLGLRNLSGFVGEVFVSMIEKVSKGNLVKNPNQDGYPDLLLNNSSQLKQYFESMYETTKDKKYFKGKSFFSPYKFGGIEVKATVGSTPPTGKVRKPIIGEQRIDVLTKFDWKAHHTETNNLLAILWDFINEVPHIVAVFYRNDLTEDDWGNIVKPKAGGGRTTSVSIMNTQGIKKMCSGWIAVLDDSKYINKLNNKKWIGYDVRRS